MYDYFLGGGHNFAADREAAEQVKRHIPAEYFALTNRAFLRRVVRYLVLQRGIRQFLDLGSGIPTVGNVHEVAQSASSDCRIVYVDNEPVAVAHAELMLENNELATVIQADLREPATVLNEPDTGRLIDLQQPLAVLMCAVLHFVDDDDDPGKIVAEYRDALCPGSHLAMSHATDDNYPDELARAVDIYKNTATPATLRSRDQILRLFDGFTLVPPGLVFTPLWRPETSDDDVDPRRSLCYGSVGAR
jgi:SAM-dependent methyltransferase